MKFLSRFRFWQQKEKQFGRPKDSRGPLREFVYLDEVSVYSILASREGGIATEFTESDETSLNSEVSGAVGIGLGETRATLDSKVQDGQVQVSQVLRKAVIQTSFKTLYDIEREDLTISLPGPNPVPNGVEAADIERRLDSLIEDGWIIELGKLHRGGLLEVEIELEADPVFHLVSIISTLRELIEDNEALLGQTFRDQLPEMISMAQVFESLLSGLVPIRGRIVDFMLASIGDREVLIHRSIIEMVAADMRIETCPVFVVGVAQRDLFWKDIRQVLFSKARYTVFARLEIDGLTDKWHPVRIADVLSGIAPEFDEFISEFSESVRLAMSNASNSKNVAREQSVRTERDVVSRYAKLVIEHHSRFLEPEVIEELIRVIPREQDWLKSVDGRRTVLGEVGRRLDAKLEVETPGEEAYKLRRAALVAAGIPADFSASKSGCADTETTVYPFREEKFLDAEIIAIYW